MKVEAEERKREEKERKKREAEERKAAQEAQKRMPPSQMFRMGDHKGKFSKFDEKVSESL